MVLGGPGGGGGRGCTLHVADVDQGWRCCSPARWWAALWMALAGALRAYRGVNETISSLLLNYIAIALLNHLVEGPLRDPASLNKPSTLPIGDDNMLGNLPGLDVHWGLASGLVACLLAWVLMQRTTFGFAARMVGGNVAGRAAQRACRCGG